jgi:hypothetical protein
MFEIKVWGFRLPQRLIIVAGWQHLDQEGDKPPHWELEFRLYGIQIAVSCPPNRKCVITSQPLKLSPPA